MNWAYPGYSAWLIVIPVLMSLYYGGTLFKRFRFRKFIHPELWPKVADSVSTFRQALKATLVILALLGIIIALLGPLLGTKQTPTIRNGHQILILLDTSLSMSAQDIPPNRIERAKQEIRNLITNLSPDPAGLELFSGEAFVQCPITTDFSAFDMLLDDTQPGQLPVPGTNLETAITKGIECLSRTAEKGNVIILLTDGESFSGDAITAAHKARNLNIPIYIIGIGNTQGEPIPIMDEAGNIIDYKKDSTNHVVLTRLNETTLSQIAQISGGSYFRTDAPGAMASEKIYAAISQSDKAQFQSPGSRTAINRYQWPLIIAIILLMTEAALPTRRQRIHISTRL